MGLFSRKRPRPQDSDSASDEPSFGVYLTTDAGRPASIMVDLAAREDAPVRELPHFFAVHLPYEIETENAFPTPEQFDTLAGLGRVVLDVASGTMPHHFVGNVTTNGKRTLCFYVPSQGSLAPFTEALLSQVAPEIGEGIGFAAFEDAEWRTYFEDLYPSDEQLREIRRR